MEDQEKEINIENTNINTNLEENEIPPDTDLSKKNIIEGETNLLIKEKEEAKEEEGIKNEENNEHENNKEEINLEKENVELKENINNQELNKEENVEQIVENKEGEIIEEKNEGQIMENNEEENGAPIAENDEEENAEQIMENNEENGEENNEEEIIKAEEIKEENEEQNIINEEEDKKEIQEMHKNEEIQENQELEEKNEIIPENEYIQENKDIKENEDIKENDEVVEEQENNQEEQEYEQNLEIQGNKEANIQLGEYKERQGMHIHKKEEKEEEYEERENDKEEEYNNNEENAEYLEENQNSPGQYIQNINYEQKIQYNIINQNQAEQENLKDLEEQIYQESDQIQTNSKEKERVKKYYKIKNGEPKDSIPRIHVQSSGKFTQEYETLIKERNYEIPKMRLFERIETEKAKKQKIKNESSSIKSGIKLKINDFKELIEIPKEDYGLYANKETIILEGGIETGEYKFIGEQSEWKQNTYPIEKVQISKEEVLDEISNRKKNEKQKKVTLELIDKFYTLTEFEDKEEKKIVQENIEIKDNKEKEELNIEINKQIENPTSPRDNYSKYLLEQINKIRADPQSFIGVIEDSKDNIKKDRNGRIYYNGKIKIALSEGEPTFNEAVEYLKNCEPMEGLEFSPLLTPEMPSNLEELKNKNYLRKKVEKMISNKININSYWKDIIKDPEISFLLMIVDDNSEKRGRKRNDILNKDMKYIGISSIEINGRFVSYIVLSTSLKKNNDEI